jgi:hypothetical protein
MVLHEAVSTLGGHSTRRTMSRLFGDGVIMLEGAAHHRASDIQHQMCPSRRPRINWRRNANLGPI